VLPRNNRRPPAAAEACRGDFGAWLPRFEVLPRNNRYPPAAAEACRSDFAAWPRRFEVLPRNNRRPPAVAEACRGGFGAWLPRFEVLPRNIRRPPAAAEACRASGCRAKLASRQWRVARSAKPPERAGQRTSFRSRKTRQPTGFTLFFGCGSVPGDFGAW